jgi:hypothetical protein
MNSDMTYLAATAILTAALWIPYIRTLVFTLGFASVIGIFWVVIN